MTRIVSIQSPVDDGMTEINVFGSNLLDYEEYYDEYDETLEKECPACYGTGLDKDEIEDCSYCWGEGYVVS